MTTRTRNLLVLLGALAVAAAGAWLAGGGSEPGALDGVPAQSFLVATIDMQRLRESPFSHELARLGGGSVASVKLRCGFDPLERTTEIAMAVPEEEAPGEFGVLARSDLSPDEVTRCAAALAEARGGRARVVQSRGFVLVEDEGQAGTSRIAMRPGGPLVVGAGRWLDTILEVVRSGRGSVRTDEAHASLRAAVVGTGSPAVVVTAILPKRVRERIRRELELAPLAGEAAGAMEGVLGISQAAAAFFPGRRDVLASAAVELRCEVPEQCEAVERLVERKRKAAAADFRLRAAGLGSVLDDLRIDRKGSVLRATLHHDAEDLARTLTRLLEARSELAPAPTTDFGAGRGSPRLDAGPSEQ